LPDFHHISDILSTQIQNAKKVIIPHTGHMCNMENPILFNNIVKEFLYSTI
jgi:pimeloyl-ACP methyl ester carboxylesterase